MPDLGQWVAALPAAGAGAKALHDTFGLTRERRLRRHLEIYKDLPTEVEKAPFVSVLEIELSDFTRRAHVRMHRKLDGSTIATMGVITVTTTGMALFLWSVGDGHDWPGWVYFLARAGSVVAAVFGMAMVGVGMGQIWKDQDPNETECSSDPAAAADENPPIDPQAE